MMKYLIIAALSLTLLSCSKEAQSTDKTTNREFDVELLFEHEGVKVYRFTDAGRNIYYTDASGSTQWTRSNGKNSTTQERVNTTR
jgi:hypothetical protein